MSEEKLIEAVRLIGFATHRAYMLTLRGDITAGLSKMFEPVVGKMAMESSSYYLAFDPASPSRKGRTFNPLDSIGTLLRIEQEPVWTPEQWAEAGESPDDPIPTETVYYIETFDGREFRWENASFIRVPDSVHFGKGIGE